MKKTNLFPIVLAAIGFLALLSFLFIGVARIADYGGNEGPLLGFYSAFGIRFNFLGKPVQFDGVNWWGLSVMVVIALASVCSGVLTKSHRGWYYVSTVLAVAAALIVFFYHTSIVKMNSVHFSVVRIGTGQIISGSLLAIMAIGNVFAAYQDKQTSK